MVWELLLPFRFPFQTNRLSFLNLSLFIVPLFNSFSIQNNPSIRLILYPSNLKLLRSSSMATGRPLPKFGEWDVNNPASAEGFTVIFDKARDEKKSSSTGVKMVTPRRSDAAPKNENYHPQYPPKRKWFCCVGL